MIFPRLRAQPRLTGWKCRQRASVPSIIASGDSAILRFNKDTYSYVWPRDGAFVAIGLDAAGYPIITRHSFKFCADIVRRSGFLYQKYHPDGSWRSTWHPWIDPDRDVRDERRPDEAQCRRTHVTRT